MWSREAYGGPYEVTSAFMALEAWGRLRIDRGEAVEDVLQDVLGEDGVPAAYLLPAVDIVLSHWSKSRAAAIPLPASPELLFLYRSRYVADVMAEFPDVLGIKEWQKEPAGPVQNSDFMKRSSRRLILDERIGEYACQNDAIEQRSTLEELLLQAASGLGEYDQDSDLSNPAFMASHALHL